MDNTLQLKIITQLQDKLSAPLKKIQSVSGKSAKSIKDLRDRLKGLEAAQKDIQSFRSLTSGLKATQGALQAAQSKVGALARELKSTENPTKQLRAEFNRAVSEARKLSAQTKTQAQELQGLRSRLSSAGISTRSLGTHEKGLRADIERTNASLKQQNNQLRAVTSQQNRLAKAKERFHGTQSMAGSMAATGAAGYLGGRKILDEAVDVIRPGVEFDELMSKVQALTRLDKDSKELATLRQQARDLGASTMFSAPEAAEGQSYLAMAGFSPDAILKSMPGMLDLAKAGKTELGETADLASNILTGMNLQADQMNRVSDVLVGTFTRSNTDLRMLGDTMKYVAPIASSVGVSLEETASMAGKLADAGIQGSMGGTALRAILNRLSAPPKAASKALKQLGIRTKDAKGNLRSVSDILTELYKKTSKMGTATRAGFLKDIAGEEAVSGLQALVLQAGSGKLQAFTRTLKNTAGEAEKVAKTMADNITGDLDELSSGWEDLGISVYEGQSGVLRSLVQDLTGVVNSVGAWIRANPELTGTIVRVVAVLGGLLAVCGSITIALAALLGPLAMVRFGMAIMAGVAGKGLGIITAFTGAIKLAGSAILAMGRFLLMTPLGLVLTGIAVAAYLIWKNWDFLKVKFREIWNAISGFFTNGWETIKAKAAEAWTSVSSIFSNGTGNLLGGIMSFVSESGALFGNGWELIKGQAGATWSTLTSGFSGFWTNASASFSSGFSGLTSTITNWNPVQTLQSVFGGVSSFFSGLISDFGSFGQHMIQGLVGGIQSMAGQAREAIEKVGSGVIGWFKEKLGIRSPSRVFMQLGGYVSEGAAVGIQRTQPMALRAASAMAASVIAAGSLAPSSADAGSLNGGAYRKLRFDQRAPLTAARSVAAGPAMQSARPIEIHIHGVQNPAEVARMVRMELDRIQSREKSGELSKYKDFGA